MSAKVLIAYYSTYGHVHTMAKAVEAARATGKLALADVVELNPRHDPDGRGARTAARLVWRLAKPSKNGGGVR